MSFSVKFYLNIDKRFPKTEYPLFCYVNYNKQRFTLHTNERINPKYWDVKTKQVKRGHPGKIELQQYLDNYESKVRNIYRKLFEENSRFTYEELKARILSEIRNIEMYDFFKVYEEFIERRKTIVTENTTKKYISLRGHLERFEKKYQKIEFSKIDLNFMDVFFTYFNSLGLQVNTVVKYLDFFKTFLRDAKERKYFNNDSFEDFQMPKETNPNTISLNKDELIKILNCELSESLEKVRDVFFFQIFTGQRISDIERFDIKDVRDNVWYLSPKKTDDKELAINLIEPAMAILKKYNNILPIKSAQKINKDLKKIGEIAEINEDVKITKKIAGKKTEEYVPKIYKNHYTCGKTLFCN